MLLTRTSFSCAALALVGASLLPACKPELQEGRYSCVDGSCPDGWSCQESNKLCYSTALARPGSSGTSGRDGGDNDDAGPSDDAGPNGGEAGSEAGEAGSEAGEAGRAASGSGAAGTGSGASGSGGVGVGGMGGSGASGSPAAEPLEGCDSDTTCNEGSCVYGPDDGADNGSCAVQCNAGACEPPGVCLGMLNACLPGCSSSDDCTAPLDCLDVGVAQMQTRAVCIEVQTPGLLGTTSCMPGDGTCGRGAACAFSPDTTPAAGICSYRCDTTQNCPQGGTCLEVFPDLYQCFKPCTGPAQCGTLVCGDFDDQQLCVPQGWVGRDAPLPMPPMMM
jgi:hypothetical protein